MIKTEKIEKVEIISQNQLRDWLELNHQQKESVWLITFKKIEPPGMSPPGRCLMN